MSTLVGENGYLKFVALADVSQSKNVALPVHMRTDFQ